MGSREEAKATYADVMGAPYAGGETPLESAGVLDFVFSSVWNRPGLSRRHRRLIALTCCGAADTVGPIEANVYAALKSGDLNVDELLEFVLHFAVYCGWPKASFMNQVVMEQYHKVCAENGETPRANDLVPIFKEGVPLQQRIQEGADCFAWINVAGSPPGDTPYTYAILNFVFGEVWQRPHLSVRDRRFLTVAAVGLDDTQIPIRSHVGSALKSGDVTLEEMRELVLQFAVYSGWPKASFLDMVVTESWDRIQAEGGVRAS